MNGPTDASALPVRLAVIGGSGVAGAFTNDLRDAPSHDIQTPFGRPSAPVLELDVEGVTVLFLQRHGVGHTLPPSRVPYRANVFALKLLGVTHILATGAVGSLREAIAPTHLVAVDSTIDRTTTRDNTFYEHAAVHCDFADPFCPHLRRLLVEAADGPDVTLHPRGTYACVEGPTFGTRAESHMLRLFGADVVGMTLLPEARLAREAELPYAALCLATDYDCWRAPVTGFDVNDLPKEIAANLHAATEAASLVLARAAAAAATPEGRTLLAACPARDALRYAIWSDKSAVDPAEVRRLAPLWGRYFA